MNVLFVCNSNMCRSPLAVGVLKKKLNERNLEAKVESAGFEAFYINEPPENRAVEEGLKHNIDISDNKVRLFSSEDFSKFDKIYVMDTLAYRNALYFANDDNDKSKVEFLLNLIKPGKNESVPDPFYRKLDACEETFSIMDTACDKIAEIIAKSRVN
jgi:protein-tyrosine phosphatase